MKRLSIVALLLVVAALVAGPARARKMTFVRDAEVEHTIRLYATPLFEAAGLNPQTIDIHLIKDDRLNAFVAKGLNLFIHTGLIIRTETPEQLMGVIAHEAGHIAGGHLARLRRRMDEASTTAIASTILGAATAVATGRPGAGVAVTAGGQQVARRGLLRHTRGEEAAADQAAVKYLDRVGRPAEGLLDFMRILEDQTILAPGSQSPYVRTHPLTRDRLAFLRRHVKTAHPDDPEDPAYEADLARLHARMRGKLMGFLQPPGQVLDRFSGDDPGIMGRYARIVAHFRRDDLDRALDGIDALIAAHPEDPWFHELKGQMLFETGNLERAAEAYARAAELAPRSGLLHLGLARALVEKGGDKRLDRAVTHLEAAIDHGERRNAFVWRQLAIARGRLDRMGAAARAMAEAALLRGDLGMAKRQVEKAARKTPESGPARQHLEDLRHRVKRARREKDGG